MVKNPALAEFAIKRIWKKQIRCKPTFTDLLAIADLCQIHLYILYMFSIS